MGLDMYLSATKHLSGYAHDTADNKKEYYKMIEVLGLSTEDLSRGDSTSATVKIDVAYWRKANAIHKWFVDKCQNGEDDCRSAYVSRERLEELVDVCKKVLKHPKNAEKMLATTSGCFFGSTEYDDYFFEDIRRTLNIIKNLLSNPKFNGWDFEYSSSW